MHRNLTAPILLLFLLAASCGHRANPDWYDARDKRLPSGFYLCRERTEKDAEGFRNPGGGSLLLSRQTFVTLEGVDTLYNAPDPEYPELTLRWSAEGAQRFAAFTAQCTGRVIAFYHKGYLLTTPKVESMVTGRQLNIAGDYRDKFVQELQDSARAAGLRAVFARGR
ncbi:MAG: hypothetical protein EOO11_16045 [Chitinophagaceae bacterium]|nr:MAG: hypothetical protein EOO11_16045 [Chitinophagaceae bacterium]